jgi:hypothetical protein
MTVILPEPRKPTDVAHVNLRIRENLRRRLETEAKHHRVSLNSEMLARLEASFEATDLATTAQRLRQIVTQLETAWLRLEAIREPAP